MSIVRLSGGAQSAKDNRVSLLSSLKAGLQRTSDILNKDITELFTTAPLDDAMLENLEDSLIIADLGPALAHEIVEDLRRERFGKSVSPQEVKEFLAERIASVLEGSAAPMFKPKTKPHVVMVVGVNGSGKTTTIGKMAALGKQHYKFQLAAGDTFRAAAVEQLQAWGERSGVPVYAKGQGADSASVAFEAYDAARKNDADVLMLDTAGRLHNKTDLMNELAKIKRVLQKHDENAPHDTWLVLDATTGQNALAQAEAFNAITPLTGVIVTKLDGSAKAGVIVPLWQKFKLPIHAVGTGEKLEDLIPFDPQAFARNLVGLESQ